MRVLEMALGGFAALRRLLCRHRGSQEGCYLAEFDSVVYRCRRCGRVVLRDLEGQRGKEGFIIEKRGGGDAGRTNDA